jgi:sugar phosphate permease
MSNRWLILAVGLYAQAAACAFLYGIPFLVPALRAAGHLSLAQAGVVVAAPTFGLLATLIAWGAAADRWGEKIVMVIGLAGCGLLVTFAVFAVRSLTGFAVLLGFAGAFGASVNAASGRVVMGWFAADERGLAMGIRQMAQPLGVGVAAVALPILAGPGDYRTALLLPGGLCVVAALAVLAFVVDPPRPPATAATKARSPYRTSELWRVHASSALLVVPQFTISVFALDFLVSQRHWAAAGAGVFLAVVQLAGASGRLVAGYWSDRVGSRLRPMRLLAVASAGVMSLAAIGNAGPTWLVVLAIALGAVITVADNGLGFTATAELAGPSWTGRALGVQNTTQNITAALTPPLLGLVIGLTNYSLAFVLAAIFPLLAIFVVPVKARNRVGAPALSASPAGPRTR